MNEFRFCLYCLLIFLPFILQGHAAPVLYAAWVEAGLLTEADLLNLRKLDSDLEGHPTPVCFTCAHASLPQTDDFVK